MIIINLWERCVMSKVKRTKHKSVKWKIMVPVLIIAAVVCVGQGLFLGLRMSQVTREMAAELALIAARATAAAVDVDQLAEFQCVRCHAGYCGLL